MRSDSSATNEEKEQIKKKNQKELLKHSLTFIRVRADGCDILGCTRLINNAYLGVVSLGKVKTITRIHTVERK